MTESASITLLTDFGLNDPYVGVMKGVLWRECPTAKVIDLTHAIEPFDRVAAAFWIERVFGWFAKETVHLVVIDPGVGTARRALALRAHGHFFVAPDNGILSGVHASDASAEAREIDVAALGLMLPSRTFHGRDIFAPVAARLASGRLAFDTVGPIVDALSERVLPSATLVGSSIVGQIVTRDRFGNLLTNIAAPASARYEARVREQRLRVLDTYADADVAEIFGIFGSFGVLELALREGHAASVLPWSQGTPVELRPVS
ncbi:MAG TPA: SAM-dependent chlorinase/fluorinase [Polyangiaceae bacterium]